MTATSLRNSYPWRNALRVVRQNKKMTIVSCILYLLGLPMSVAAVMLEAIVDSHASAKDYIPLGGASFALYSGLGSMFLTAAVFLGMFAAINSFTETHKKSKVDMLYALPLTGKQRFFSDYLGGCLVYIVPYLISAVLGGGILLVLSGFIDFGTTVMSDTPSWGAFIAEFGKLYVLGTLGLFFLMLLYYTLSTLVTVCCGTLFESIYTNILLNFLIPGTVALVLAVIANEVSLEFEYIWDIIGYMSPIGGLIYLVFLLTTNIGGGYTSTYKFAATQTQTHAMLPSYIRWSIIILVLTALLLVLAWQLYVRRKAEDVGKPFIYTFIYYVMLTLGTIAILCLMEVEVIGPAILFSAIVYFVMEVIRRRGFKRFWVSVITYIATVAVSVGCFFAITLTGCFGRVNYVPAAIGISSVKLEFDTMDQHTSLSYDLEYTDREVISAVTDLHREILRTEKDFKQNPQTDALLEKRYAELVYNGNMNLYDGEMPSYDFNLPVYGSLDGNYTQYSDYNDEYGYRQKWLDPTVPLPDDVVAHYGNTYSLEITYYTLAGTTIHRSYSVYPDQMQAALNIVRGTALFADASANGLQARFENSYGQWDSNANVNRVPSMIELSLAARSQINHVEQEHKAYIEDAPQKLAALTEAYRADLAAMTEEDFRKSDIYGYLANVPVYEKCTGTIALLKEYGIKGFDARERFGLSSPVRTTTAVGEFTGLRIYTPETSRTASGNYPHSTVDTMYVTAGDPAYEDYLSGADGSADIEEIYPELYALLDAVQSNYVTDENCYMIDVGGVTYILPEKDSALAEAVIAKGSGYGVNAAMEAYFGDDLFSDYTPGSSVTGSTFEPDDGGEYGYFD